MHCLRDLHEVDLLLLNLNALLSFWNTLCSLVSKRYTKEMCNFISVCGPGTFRPDDSSPCMPCGLGRYKSGTGNNETMCLDCFGGTVGTEVTTNMDNATDQSQCCKCKPFENIFQFVSCCGVDDLKKNCYENQFTFYVDLVISKINSCIIFQDKTTAS